MAKCSWCKSDATETWSGLCSKCWDADEIREVENESK
jgi:hypothetical protein